ncbi:TPA: hypothetical protein QDC03_001995 [Burkholderia cepacia]|uniref:hypothetical protein n=1 Tax=Burkholderia cepacia TaxID=292 RepID=UPI0011B2412F|nr:hypothetical protein [Burkholderia cepacia]HDR9506928.1 hypothetical protein [Burkholderia cepacia]
MGKKSRLKRERKISQQQTATANGFSGSAEIDELMQPAEPERTETLIRTLLDRYPGSIDDELVKYLTTNARTIHIREMSGVIAEREVYRAGKPQAESAAFGDFLTVQCLNRLIHSHFDQTASYPSALVSVFEWGVGGLHKYALDQARQLARVAMTVAHWCLAADHSRVTIVDSPLGGTVPAQVLAKVLEADGIEVRLVEFLAPRLARHSKKHSIREAVKGFVKSLESDNSPVFYPDEMISGSRFLNLYRALRAKLGDRLIPIASEVHSWNATTEDTAEKTAKAVAVLRNETTAAASSLVHFRFPPSRRLTIDSGPPVIPNSPFYWGEVDTLAGKRKVNFVFDVINELRAISEAFKRPDSEEILTLQRLWARDTNGRIYSGALLHLQTMLPRMASQIDWSKIEDAARTVYASEYVGNLPVITENHAIERLVWLKKEIVRNLDPEGFDNGKPTEAHLFANALHTLFNFHAHGRRLPRPKNRDYCEYTIKYAMPLAAINAKLVSLVIEEVTTLREYASTISKTSGIAASSQT